MSTAPASISSSPASMRSAVVLPEPDGPTSTMNSPSAMSRFSPSTAGASFPGYIRVASTKRTSANTHLLELGPQPPLRLRARRQLVEAKQRSSDDRRRRRRPHGRLRRVLERPGADRRKKIAVSVLQHATAEEDLGRLVAQTEPLQGNAPERHDFGCEPPDDLRRDGVVGRFREHEWRQLDHSPLRDAPEVDRLRELARRFEAEVRRH